MIEAAHTEKTADILDILWAFPGIDGLELLRHGADTARADDVADKFDLWLGKCAFCFLYKELVLSEARQHLGEVLEVIVVGVVEDDDVVHADIGEVAHVVEDVFH